MPLIEVKLYDRRINDEVVPAVIEKLTDAICEVIGEESAATRGCSWRACRPSSGASAEGPPT